MVQVSAQSYQHVTQDQSPPTLNVHNNCVPSVSVRVCSLSIILCLCCLKYLVFFFVVLFCFFNKGFGQNICEYLWLLFLLLSSIFCVHQLLVISPAAVTLITNRDLIFNSLFEKNYWFFGYLLSHIFMRRQLKFTYKKNQNMNQL